MYRDQFVLKLPNRQFRIVDCIHFHLLPVKLDFLYLRSPYNEGNLHLREFFFTL
jgi:hypothetical protein